MTVQRFSVGRFECVAVLDGVNLYTPEQFFANAPAGELARYSLGDEIRSAYSCLLVDTGAHRVMVDTGGRGLGSDVGRFAEGFAESGWARADVDTVVDMEPDRTVMSRRRVLDRAADAGSLVQAFHFYPFPGLGRVTRQDGGAV